MNISIVNYHEHVSTFIETYGKSIGSINTIIQIH